MTTKISYLDNLFIGTQSFEMEIFDKKETKEAEVFRDQKLFVIFDDTDQVIVQYGPQSQLAETISGISKDYKEMGYPLSSLRIYIISKASEKILSDLTVDDDKRQLLSLQQLMKINGLNLCQAKEISGIKIFYS